METKRNNLTPRQTQALQMILGGSSITQVAQAVNASRKTLYKWIAQPPFAKALTDERTLALERLSQSLANLSEKAVGVLSTAMDDPSSTVRVRAADIALSRMLALKDSVEFEKRISALESAVTHQRTK